jgi:hypothetical protein
MPYGSNLIEVKEGFRSRFDYEWSSQAESDRQLSVRQFCDIEDRNKDFPNDAVSFVGFPLV